MIRFDHFGWCFTGSPGDALLDVNLHVGRGEFVVIAGPSGSGKTTLALAMCGLLIGRQDGRARGGVQVGGMDVAATPLHELSTTIALVQQNPESHFATLTVSDEVAFGLENRCLPPKETLERSATALDRLSIAHLRDRSLATLSGGEQQRVAIASIVTGEPAVIVLDEPTASLDPEASRDLFQSLADLCRRQGLTVIVIEHKLAQLLQHEPRLIRLEAGRVVGDSAVEAAGDATLLCESRLNKSRLNSTAYSGPALLCESRPDAQPVARLSHATVRLDGRVVLDDVSLAVQPGDIIAVLGPNGGGKTTLLLALLGLLELDDGEARVCGQPVSPRTVSRLAGQVGVVLQNADHQLVADSVWHEALFAVRALRRPVDPASRSAAELLARAGLADRREDHPYRLSWGQKRRLNLISAVLHQPRLLLLDEPFAGQDWENAEFLLNVLRGVVSKPEARPASGPDEVTPSAPAAPPAGPGAESRGACLLVTHDPRIVARSSTRLLFITAGRITLDAPLPEALRRLEAMGHDAYVLRETGF